MIIESFEVECFRDGEAVFAMKTVFGFFPTAAFAQQVGLPVRQSERARLEAPCDRTVDLTTRPARYCDGAARLPGPMLLMLDRVTGYWPDGGRAGLGRLRAEKDVDPGEWFFKAHFFQDPVQPGSLGVEAMCQLLQFYMIERGLGEGVPHPRFEPLMLGHDVTWKYRGQVVPHARRVVIEVEIVESGRDDRGPFVVAEGWLWVDGTRLYSARGLTLRIVPGTPPATEEVFDPGRAPWVLDHRPTYTRPTLPMTCVVERLAAAAAAPQPGQRVVGLRDVRLSRWLVRTSPSA